MSLSERLNNLAGKEDLTPSKDEENLPEISDSAALVQRCVIIQRDEKGYGLTVSGDNPVYVQSVKEGGAASRAGVHQGDKIVKVNGSLVTSSNHIEVVKLIKSGSYVALTLIGRPQSQQPKSPDAKLSPAPVFLEKPPITPPPTSLQSDRVTAPLPVDAKKSRELTQQKLDTIKAMHKQAIAEYDKLRNSNDQSPYKIKALLEDKLKTVKTLEKLRSELFGSLPDGHDTLTSRDSFIISDDISMDDSGYSPNINSNQPKKKSKHAKSDSVPVTIYKSSQWQAAKSIVRSNSDAQSKQRKIPKTSTGSNRPSRSESERSEGRYRTNYLLRKAFSLPSTADPGSPSDSSLNSPNSSPTPLHAKNRPITESLDEPMDATCTTPVRPQIDVICTEDDEFSSEDDHVEVHSPFTDLSQVQKRPAYMAVLLHYLISNSDPAPLFFYGIAESYLTAAGSVKDLRKWAYEIYSVFLVPKAPLKVDINEAHVTVIDDALMYKHDKEDYLRTIFEKARDAALVICKELLQDFNNKDILGLANLYGAHELHENMTKVEEGNIIDKYLMGHFEHLQKMIGGREGGDQATERNYALSAALVWFIRQANIKNNGSLDRVPTFIAKEKRSKLSGWHSKKNFNIKTHQFMNQHYTYTTMCNFCGEMIVGVGYQGYQCTNCELNYHMHCLQSIEDTCLKRKSKRMSFPRRPTSIIGNFTQSQIIMPPKLDGKDKETPLPTSPQIFEIKPLIEEKDPDLDKFSEHSSVTDLVGKYNINSATENEAKIKVERIEVQRSESMKGQNDYQKAMREPTRRAKSDLDIDDSMKSINNSGSSSASSLSASTSVETFPEEKHLVVHVDDDSDFDVEPELPPTKNFVTDEMYKRLKPKEKKRLDVINELFYTERTHVRNLKVLDKVFCRPMTQDPNIPNQLVNTLFPNLEEIVALHGTLNYSMKMRHKESPLVSEVGDLLLQRFDGDAGNQFRDTCAIFCRNQSYALEMLKQKQRRDERINKFFLELESNPLCRRLQLKDLIPTVVHRLTKYPLLIENLCKYTTASTEEHIKLELALKCSKHILDYVNQAVRECENHQRLVDLNRHLDRKQLENQEMLAEFKALDLTQHTLLKEGPLVWRVSGQKQIPLHVVLLQDLLILFQKQDDKLLLKCQSTVVVAGKDDTKYTHSPVIRLTNLLTRHVATDKKGFFLVNTSNQGPQIYELIGSSKDEREKWFKAITEAAETNKRLEPPDPSNTSALTVPVEAQLAHGDPDEITMVRPQISIKKRPSSTISDSGINTYSSSPERTDLDSPYGQLGLTRILDVCDSSLIQPDEVTITDLKIARAESVLTPLEKLRRNDEKIRESLQERQQLMNEIMGLDISDSALDIEPALIDEVESSRDARALVATAIQLDNRMVTVLTDEISTDNIIDSTQISEEEGPPSEGSGGPTGAVSKFRHLPTTIDKVHLAQMANRMNEILTKLMSVVNTREDERDSLRDELRTAHEQLNLLRSHHMDEALRLSKQRPASMISVGSSGSYCMEDTPSRTPGDVTGDEADGSDKAGDKSGDNDELMDPAALLRLGSAPSGVSHEANDSKDESFDDADHFEEALSYLPGPEESTTTPNSDATEISPTFESTTDDFGQDCGSINTYDLTSTINSPDSSKNMDSTQNLDSDTEKLVRFTEISVTHENQTISNSDNAGNFNENAKNYEHEFENMLNKNWDANTDFSDSENRAKFDDLTSTSSQISQNTDTSHFTTSSHSTEVFANGFVQHTSSSVVNTTVTNSTSNTYSDDFDINRNTDVTTDVTTSTETEMGDNSENGDKSDLPEESNQISGYV